MILSDALSEAVRNDDPLGRRLGQAALAGLATLPFALFGMIGVDHACYHNEGNVRSAPTDGTAADHLCRALIPGHPNPGVNWQVLEGGLVVAIAIGLMLLPISRVLRMMLVAALALTVIATGVLSNFLDAFEPRG